MAGIFNLFGETPESDRGQLAKPHGRSKSSLGLSGPVGKSVGLSKPKGLSIRSNSNVNVPVTPRINLKQEPSGSKQPQLIKPKVTQLDNTGRPISPSREYSAKKLNSKKSKEPSPKTDSSDNKLLKEEKSLDQVIFKKPLPMKKTKKSVFPEPESLAPYSNIQDELENIYWNQEWDNGFLTLIKNTPVKLYEDEGFESDPEHLLCSNMPALSMSSIRSEEGWQKGWNPELPAISDDEF